jgi:outer membrane lipoprotein carrier protein
MKYLPGLLLMLPLLANAGGVDRLKNFLQKTGTLRAQFHQVVVDAQGKKVQEVDGSMQLLRPGKFRWDYNKPFQQEIVGDGEKVWLYDPELNQVTVRVLSKALGSSPAALLSGSQDMEKNFVLKDKTHSGALEWVLATPKVEESGFERVLLGFNDETLQAMELYDSFGHTTLVTFTKLELNPKLAASTFRFTPPAGADVVGE